MGAERRWIMVALLAAAPLLAQAQDAPVRMSAGGDGFKPPYRE